MRGREKSRFLIPKGIRNDMELLGDIDLERFEMT